MLSALLLNLASSDAAVHVITVFGNIWSWGG
ncbi:hypothetical protein FHW15_000952 [Terracoccus luteus]|uniref:Uncharacterized protein n=1 Tax=Terracoccus luteus TaxID=53356 RepID=A0A839PNE7_9MICO|nr:hypothetical protein [Terracoccus luteus]MCP2171460.1 hypothetical protein [Terracoccus luteus]